MSADFSKLLAGMRDDFVAELPDRCNLLEQCVLALDRGIADDFEDLLRHIHSLKGSGGTFGLPMVTGICHQFESFVSAAYGQFNPVAVSHALSYVDLLRRVADAPKRDDAFAFAINRDLDHLCTVSMPSTVAELLTVPVSEIASQETRDTVSADLNFMIDPPQFNIPSLAPMPHSQTQESLVNVKSEMTLESHDLVCQVLLLQIQEVTCAMDINYVERVFSLVELQQIPQGPPHLVGLLNYYGQNCLVVDLGIWLGMDCSELYTLDTPIVLCSNGCIQIGFVVSEVLQLEVLDTVNIQNKDTFDNVNSPFTASFNSSSGVFLLLDMYQIMKQNFAHAIEALH